MKLLQCIGLLALLIPIVLCSTHIGQKYKVYGLFASCLQHHNRSLFNHRAEFHQNVAQTVYQDQNFQKTSFIRYVRNAFNYSDVDLCTSFESLTNFAIGMLLSEGNILNTEPPKFRNRTLLNWKNQPTILFCLTFLPPQMDLLLAEILSPSNIIILNMREKNRYPFNPHMSQLRFVSFLDHILTLLDIVLDMCEWKQANMIRIEDESALFKHLFLDIEKLFVDKKMCLNVEVVHYQDKNRIQALIHRILGDPTSKLNILVGDMNHQREFINLLNSQTSVKSETHRYWLLMNYPKGNRPAIPKNSTMYTLGDGKISRGSSEYVNSSHYIIQKYADLVRKVDYSVEYIRYLFEGFELLHTLYLYRHGWVWQDLNIFRRYILSGWNRVGIAIDVNNRQTVIFDGKERVHSGFPVTRLKSQCWKTACKPVRCDAGKEYYYGRTDCEDCAWNISFAHACRYCRSCQFKQSQGNFSCSKCPFETKSSKDRTKCVALYKESHLSLSDISMKLSLGGVTTTVLLNLGILTIFIRNRRTPVVSSIDFNLTIIHLSCATVLSATLFALYIIQPSPITCMLRPIVFSLFYICSIAIILMRYKRLFKAFHGAPIAVTKREALIDGISRYLYIAGIIIVSGMLLVVIFEHDPAGVSVTKSTLTFEKHLTCNTTFHTNIMIGVALILQSLCFVQAFRSRHLPDTFKDVMSLIYGSFAISLSFGVMYPIQVFQKNPESQEMVQLIVILLNNFLFVNFCYMARAYIIVFKPHLNTTKHVRRQLHTFSNVYK